MTTHLIVFLAGIVCGILVQPFLVPETPPTVFVPDVPKANCPPCSSAASPVFSKNECPKCEECKTESCPVCESNTVVSKNSNDNSCPSWFYRTTQDYFPAGAQQQFKGAMGQGWWFLGCKSDVDEVLDILKLFYEGPDVDGVFVDIGANLGQVTENLMQTFGNIPWNRYKRKYGLDGLYCKNDPQPGAEVYMFEPQPNNAGRIKQRMELSDWHLERVHLIEAAVSNYSGTADFEYTGEFSETGSLGGAKANYKGDRSTVTVDVVTFDEAYDKHFKGKKIYMLKCDTEGFDGTVVRGAEKVLASGKLRFLTFEYHSLWFENETGDTLFDILKFLEGYNYMCYFILPNRLIPLSGSYWRNDFEMKRWSNVFCGKKDDFLLEKLVYMYHISTLNGREETNLFETKDDAMEFFFKNK